MDHLQRLQREDAGDAWARLRDPIRPDGGRQSGIDRLRQPRRQPAYGYPDIPAQAVVVSDQGTIYVANDFGVVSSKIGSGKWSNTAAGLPNVTVSDLVLVRERGVLYAGTHGQGVWSLKVR